MNKEELINLINSLGLDKEDFTVLSSGALVIRGIWPEAHDLDLAVTKKGLEDLSKKFNIEEKDIAFTSGLGFFKVSDNIECILDDMENKRELKDGIYIEDIKNYYNFIKNSGREKDQKRIPLIEEYMRGELNGKKL